MNRIIKHHYVPLSFNLRSLLCACLRWTHHLHAWARTLRERSRERVRQRTGIARYFRPVNLIRFELPTELPVCGKLMMEGRNKTTKCRHNKPILLTPMRSNVWWIIPLFKIITWSISVWLVCLPRIVQLEISIALIARKLKQVNKKPTREYFPEQFSEL